MMPRNTNSSDIGAKMTLRNDITGFLLTSSRMRFNSDPNTADHATADGAGVHTKVLVSRLLCRRWKKTNTFPTNSPKK